MAAMFFKRRSSVLLVLAVLLTPCVGFSQPGQEPSRTIESAETAPARLTAEAKYHAAEERSLEAARDYRAEADKKSSSAEELATLKLKLSSTVAAAFEAFLELQQIRIDDAEQELLKVQDRYKRRMALRERIIERRVADLMDGDRVEPSAISSGFVGKTSAPVFATPQALLDYISANQDVAVDNDGAAIAHTLKLVADDEIDRFTGLMLRTVSMMQMAAGLGAVFGTSESPQDDATGFLKAVGRMNTIVADYKISHPSPQAIAAHQRVAGGLDLSLIFQGGQPAVAKMSVQDYSVELRLAAGVVRDRRQLLAELIDAMAEISETASSTESGDEAAENTSKPEWQLTVNGDTAIAENVASDLAAKSSFNPLQPSQRMELVKVGKTWQIASLIPDQVIMEIQQGFTVSESSTSPPMDRPSPYPTPVVTASPHSSAMTKTATMASRDLRPFTQLSESDVVRSVVFTESEEQPVVPLEAAVGKYINRPVKNGQQITLDLLVDKPSVQQIAAYWLEEAEAGGDVFEPMRSQSEKYHTHELYSMDFPFSASYAERFNGKLPDWTAGYLQAVTERLDHGAPVDWDDSQLRLLRSLGELVHYQTVNEGHDLSKIGAKLENFVTSDFSTLASGLNRSGELSKAAHSMVILGELVRINGRLPETVLAAKPTDESIRKKLQLLQMMTENGADDTWIQQERRRLFGLLEEAPVQALKLLLTSKQIGSHGLLETWIFSISSEQTHSAWRASPQDRFSPPLDPALAIAVAELLAGKNAVTDENLALLFQRQHPGNMFSRHMDDLLSSELMYRDAVLQMLVSLYRKSTSEPLRVSIGKAAPAVRVLAATERNAPP